MALGIPAPVKALFETFPLKKYPASSKLSDDDDGLLYFGVPDDVKQKDAFTIGVLNLQKVEEKFVPTDPFGLFECLYLCYKHRISLPTGTNTVGPFTVTSMLYEASPNNELPLFIENVDGQNSLINLESFQNVIKKKFFQNNTKESLLNDFLDDLRDLWILILLVDLTENDKENFKNIFGLLSKHDSSPTLSSLLLGKYILDVAQWGSFTTKHPEIFSKGNLYGALQSRNLHDYLAQSSFEGLKTLYTSKLNHFARTIPLISSRIQGIEDSAAKDILELKLASFMFTVMHFISEKTVIGKLVRNNEFKNIRESADKIVLQY